MNYMDQKGLAWYNEVSHYLLGRLKCEPPTARNRDRYLLAEVAVFALFGGCMPLMGVFTFLSITLLKILLQDFRQEPAHETRAWEYLTHSSMDILRDCGTDTSGPTLVAASCGHCFPP